MYRDLFNLCGFEDEEINSQKSRIEKVFGILGIGKDDLENGSERIRKYFDIELLGVRKLLGCWLNEVLDAVLAREENNFLGYSNFPGVPLALTACQIACEDAYVGIPEIPIQIIMGQVFDKINPILEAAEEGGLPPGGALCGLSQTHVGQIIKGIIPTPDAVISAGAYCDQATKADELLHERYNVPHLLYMDGFMDGAFDEWPISKKQIEYYGDQVKENSLEFIKLAGSEFTPEVGKKAYRQTGALFSEIRGIEDLLKNDPVPISFVDGTLWFWMEGQPIRSFERAMDALKTLRKELDQRVQDGKGIGKKGAPRIYFTAVPLDDPSILRMVEDVGLVVNCTFQNQIPTIDRVPFQFDSIWHRISEAFYRLTNPQADRNVAICKEFNADGAIIFTLFSCRPLSSTALMQKKCIPEKLGGLPVLVVEGDVYDSRTYSAGQLRTRIETFAEMLKVRKAAA